MTVSHICVKYESLTFHPFADPAGPHCRPAEVRALCVKLARLCVFFRGNVYKLQCLLQPLVALLDTQVSVSQTHPAL